MNGLGRYRLGPLLMLTAFLIAGCADDGEQGAAGAPGIAGPPGTSVASRIAEATQINATITGVTVGSAPVVQFFLTDEKKNPAKGLPSSSISFSIAQLVPGNNGGASEWRNYITRTESAGGGGPGIADQVQATTENGSNGTLIDNEDGTYTYIFATDLNTAAVPYDATLTHRVGFEIRGLAAATSNAVYTFRPSDGATTALFSREMVKDASCNACHDKLALHGNARFETKYCVTCHNPGSTDANSGNTLDFKVMIHKIHRGKSLPSVSGGGEYAIWGFRDTKHDYSKVVWPQDIRNCRTCHDETDPDTPEAGNWMTMPTMEACGSCHDDIDFASGANHSDANIVVSGNADCTICHSEGGLIGSIDASHALLEQAAASAFQFNIHSIQNTVPGAFPMITFSITDPTQGDAPYNIQSDPPFVQGGGASRIAIDLGWDSADFSNTGSGRTPASMISINPLGGGSIANGDGTYTATSSVAIPAGVTGSGMVAIEGHPAVDVENDGDFERIGVRGASAFFAITDAAPVERRAVISIDKCNNCHKSLSLHGANRTDHIDLCAGCHNPNNTDISRRPANPADAPDGKKEESIDFKRMIHALHAGQEGMGLVVYGFGNRLHDFREVEFPGNLNNCLQCHLTDTYYPVGTGVLATTVDTGTDLADPLDDVNITPNAAVCSACHNSLLASEHMKQNGGAFDVTQAADGTLTSASAGVVVETCAVCHGKDKLADIKKVHQLE